MNLNKKDKLKELYAKLQTLQGKDVLPTNEIDALIKEEVSNLSSKLSDNPTIKILKKFSEEISQFKKDFDLKPVSDSIQALEQEITDNQNSLIADFSKTLESKLSEVKKTIPTLPDPPKPFDSSNLENEITTLRSQFLAKQDYDPTPLQKELKTLRDGLKVYSLKSDDETSDAQQRKDLEDKIDSLRKDLLSRLSGVGGGAMGTKFTINTSVLSTKYKDINLKGSGVTYSATDNNTTKMVDLTLTAAGGGGSGTVTSVLAGTGITVDSSTPATPTVALGNTSVVTGTYGTATQVGAFTVNAQGRLTAASTIGIGSLPGSSVFSMTGGQIPTSVLGTGTASNGTFLRGDQTWQTVSATPGGANTQVQYNDSAAFGGSSTFTWNKNTSVLSAAFITSSVLSASKVVVTDASSQLANANPTTTEVNYVVGVTSSVVSINNTQTLTNKTLVTPSIASFAQAQHTHQDGAGGGLLNGSSVFSMTGGQIKASVLGTGTASSSTYLRGDNSWATVSATPGGADTNVQFNDAAAFGGSAQLTFAKTTGTLTVVPTARTSGSPNTVVVTQAADTTLAASTESTGINLNMSATRQFSTGSIVTQREIVIQAPTYGFAGASTITNAVTLDINSPPIAGTNATITNAYALRLTGLGSSGKPIFRVNAGSGAAFMQINDNGTMVLDSDASSGSFPLTVKYNGATQATINFQGIGTFNNITSGSGNAQAMNIAGGFGSIDKAATYVSLSATFSNDLRLFSSNTANYVLLQPSGGNAGIGVTAPAARLQLGGNISAASWTTTGIAFDSTAATYTDTSTAAAGTVAVRTANSFGASTFASTNAITVTDAFTLYVPKPIAGTNTTITRANSAYFEGNVGIGTTGPGSLLHVNGGVQVGAAPTGGDKGTGTANFAADIYKNGTAYTNPDYVLEHWATGKIEKYIDKEGAKDYAGLAPLSEVKDFTQKNWHLPRFGQNAEHGLFGGGDSILASLEEAYLYIFQLKDKLDTLENELSTLRGKLK